ncbi:polysaccharide biosynthesis protein [Oceanospirillaceae bacterium]|nr:polysaccharide biosynthesis protein [Oceanospirillaceae bacterium]
MHNIFKGILAIPRPAKRSILIAADSVLLIGALWLSFSLRLDNWYWPRGGVNNPIVLLVLFAPVFAVPVFAHFGLYRAIIRYLGMRAVWSIVKAVMVYAALWGLVAFLSGVEGVPRSVVPINAMVAVLTVGGSRMFARWLLRKIEDSVRIKNLKGGSGAGEAVYHQTRVVIFGAGAAGRQLAIGLGQSRECILLAFADDGTELHGRDLMGVPIISQEKLQNFVVSHQVDDILLAMPSITRKQRSVIIEHLRPLNVRIRTLPGLIAMAQGKADYEDLHDLDINDLLAREPAEPDEVMLQQQVTGRTVMVTGAGGSIGSELCRQILQRKPKVLLLFELSEFSLYTLHNELLDTLHHLTNEKRNHGAVGLVPSIIPLLGSVADESRVSDIILTWKPNIIYHAAAVKHVPIVEHNIAECVKNNVLGTLVMAKVAIERQVERFILVSTDKAVNPTNAMGTSKRCCELILQALAAEQNPSFEPMWDGKPSAQIPRTTQLSMVRFGNVLGSSGSVVPYFRQQIAQGGPITLTHQDIIRYFMTIPEAAQLVMQTGAMAGGSFLADGASKDIGAGISADRIGGDGRVGSEAEVYVLDMGEPVKIIDLAHRMVELSGFRVKDENSPEGDIAIEVVGLRPGEKLYEELLIGNNPQTTQHPRIMKANEKFLPWSELQPMITTLRIAAVNGDVLMIRSMLQQLVPEYQPDQNVVDWVYKEQIAQADRLEF